MSEFDIYAPDLESDLIKAFGVKEGCSIYSSVMATHDRLSYANLRLLNIQRVIREMVSPNFEAWLDGDVEEPEGVFHRSQRDIRMLATEAVQHLHASFDPLARAIYCFTTPAAERRIVPHKISFASVNNEQSGVAAKYRKILSEIASKNSFFHISALSNLAKHSYIVRPAFTHSSESHRPEDAENAIVFQTCRGVIWLGDKREKRINTVFPSMPISKFLKEEIMRVIPPINQLVGLIRTDLDLRLKAIK